MADKKISQLTPITGASLVSDDEFVVVDTSADETKSITYSELSGLFATAAQGTLADSAVQPNDSPTFGSVTVTGTVDGRDVASDGTKLDGIEANADVTDTANVTAAGALMDSEVVNLAQVKAFDSADYATAAQGTLADSAVQPNDSPTFGGLTVDTDTLYVDATNNRVGIGTSSPSAVLEVAKDANPSVKLDDIGNWAVELHNYGSIGSFAIDNGGTERMRIDSSGNVGIGKISPATPLDVNGTVTATAFAGDGSALTGIAAGAGGGGSDEIFWENGQNVTTNYTITNGKNAMSAGPITVDSGVTVTVGAGEVWTVV